MSLFLLGEFLLYVGHINVGKTTLLKRIIQSSSSSSMSESEMEEAKMEEFLWREDGNITQRMKAVRYINHQNVDDSSPSIFHAFILIVKFIYF